MREKSEQTRARIIQAAIEEMQQAGYQKASMRRIAEKAGITAGALYWYFDGKEQLFESIGNEIIGKLSAQQKELLPENLEKFTDAELKNLFYQESSLQMFQNMQEYIPFLYMIVNNGNPEYYQKKKKAYLELSADYAQRYYEELYKRKLIRKSYSYAEVYLLCEAEFSAIHHLLEQKEVLEGISDEMLQGIRTLFRIMRYGIGQDLDLASEEGGERA